MRHIPKRYTFLPWEGVAQKPVFQEARIMSVIPGARTAPAGEREVSLGVIGPAPIVLLIPTVAARLVGFV